MEESTENQYEKMFNSIIRELASWTKIHIDNLHLYITLTEELPIKRRDKLYQKYSFGNLSHYTLFYSFMCELQSTAKNENLNPLGVLKAILNLVETYQNKLILVHVELDKFLKQSKFISFSIHFLLNLFFQLISISNNKLTDKIKNCDDVFIKFKKKEAKLFQRMGVNGEGSYICLFFHSCYFSRIQMLVSMGAKKLSAWQPELSVAADNIQNSIVLIHNNFNEFRKQQNI